MNVNKKRAIQSDFIVPIYLISDMNINPPATKPDTPKPETNLSTVLGGNNFFKQHTKTIKQKSNNNQTKIKQKTKQ